MKGLILIYKNSCKLNSMYIDVLCYDFFWVEFDEFDKVGFFLCKKKK